MPAKDIIAAALTATTLDDATRVQRMIADAIGAEYRRPLGDKPNNSGLIKGAGGSYDHKLIENVTNMQDAVLERHAVERFGSMEDVPYVTPHEAARDLLGRMNYQRQGDFATVTFYESDPPTSRTKRLTVVFRDRGCGMTAAQVPDTIFALGGAHKEGIFWLQGAFGLGGATTFRNAAAVVLVTRRAPKLLRQGEPSRIVVAVLQWELIHKNDGAFYLVTSPWSRASDDALPYEVPASAYPEFEPGTHLALISYGVEGYHRARQGDEKSFATVAETRLFKPVLPIRFNDRINPKGDDRYLRGLFRKLEGSTRENRQEGEDLLPFNVGGVTYQLPVRYWFFAKKGEAGERKNFVAHDHVVLLTSNGQVHAHWTPQEFRYRTELIHLFDRILVEVETDTLPIEVRTSLFTADRSDTVRNEDAIQLQEAIAGHLKGWHELQALEKQLVREAISGPSEGRSTLKIAQQISRALEFRLRGFSMGGRGQGGDGEDRPPRESPPSPPPQELYEDPTALEGPERVVAEVGKTKSITFTLNAVDSFIPRRAELSVECDHPEITEREITVGVLRAGRVRVSIAVPAGVELGVYRLRVAVRDWFKASGGLGPELGWETKFELVDEARRRTPPGAGDKSGKRGAGVGKQVALVWKRHEDQAGWDAATVGVIEYPTAADLARLRPEYEELAALGEAPVPTVTLNEHYYLLKMYLDRRGPTARQQRIDQIKDDYAVGVGVGLLILEQQDKQSRKSRKGQEPKPLDPDTLMVARQAVAQGVLSMLPKFDLLVREANLDPDAGI
jgi:hypothetical protein